MSASDKTLGVWEDPTKSELTFPADISKSLHQEGNWYIIPREYCYCHFGTTPVDSHVVHVCGKDWISQEKITGWKDGSWTRNPYTCGRVEPKTMQDPCRNCGETPPEGLVGLWFLHNWDYL